MTTTRRYDTEAMDALVAAALTGTPDIDYLVAALQHYRAAYSSILAEREAIEQAARSVDLWSALTAASAAWPRP